MACHHQHNHHQSPPTCYCSHRLDVPPPSPPPSVDPFLLQSIVSQLLQTPQISHLYSAAPTAAASPPFDLHPGSSHYQQYQNQKRPKQKQPQPHRQQFEDQFQDQYSVLASLVQRIDVLESSLHRFSSTTSFSLRQLAARTIQIHFRAHLVRRSRALRELKVLASIKSSLNVLKSSLSLQKRIDFFSLSHEALDLIIQLETIQSGDQMVRESKRSIRREIGQFLELVDEICVKRNTVSLKTVKQIRIGRIDEKSRVSNAGRESSGGYHRNKASKQRNVDSGEKKLIDNLRGRVERIQHISKALKDEEEDSADSDDGNGNGVIHRKIHTGRESSGAYHRNKASKQRNLDNDEKKVIDNLRERVERIQHMSKAVKDEEEDSADSDDGNENGVIHSKIHTGRESSGACHRNKASKQQNLDNDEKKLVDNLRKRVERIQNISKVLKDEEEDSADSDDGNGNGVIQNKIHAGRKHRVRSDAEKHVCFAEDGNPAQVYDIHEDEKVPMKRVYCNAERKEDSVDEEESDNEENDAESAEGSEFEDEDQNGSEFEDEDQNGSVEGSSQCSEGEGRRKVEPSLCQDEKLTLSPPPIKMEGRMV